MEKQQNRHQGTCQYITVSIALCIHSLTALCIKQLFVREITSPGYSAAPLPKGSGVSPISYFLDNIKWSGTHNLNLIYSGFFPSEFHVDNIYILIILNTNEISKQNFTIHSGPLSHLPTHKHNWEVQHVKMMNDE